MRSRTGSFCMFQCDAGASSQYARECMKTDTEYSTHCWKPGRDQVLASFLELKFHRQEREESTTTTAPTLPTSPVYG